MAPRVWRSRARGHQVSAASPLARLNQRQYRVAPFGAEHQRDEPLEGPKLLRLVRPTWIGGGRTVR